MKTGDYIYNKKTGNIYKILKVDRYELYILESFNYGLSYIFDSSFTMTNFSKIPENIINTEGYQLLLKLSY